jgi:iron(III) transport system substrate-binding protein
MGILSRPGRPRKAAAIMAAMAALALASCSSAGTPAASSPTGTTSATSIPPASLASLIAQSKAENALTFYANVPADLFKPVLDAFTSRYPWIKINDQELSDPEIFSRVAAEQGQGSPTADLMISTYPVGFVSASERGLLKTDYTPAGLQNFPAFARQGPGMYVMEVDPMLAGYNMKLLSPAQAPHSFADLAKLAAEGKTLTTYPISHPIGYAGVWAYTTQRGAAAWAVLAKLAPATKTIDDGTTQLEGAIKGQFAAGYFSSGLGRAFIQQYKGLFNMNYTTDFEPLIPRGMAIPAKANHPASAQLFMDFIYSKAGQDAVCQAGLTAFMNNYKSSTGCRNSLADIQAHVPAANIYLVPFTKQLIADQAAITARWNKLHFQS